MAGFSSNTSSPFGTIPSSIISASKRIVVPVTTDVTYSAGPIILTFVIIGFLIGIALYLYMRNHHNEYSQGGRHMVVIITNKSQIPYTVFLPDGRNIQLAPDQSARVSVAHYDIVSAKGYNVDGTLVTHSYNISNPTIHQLYISPSGFRTDNTGSDNVQLVNHAPYPVIFVERSSKGGRRWASDIVPPQGITEGNFIGARTTWEVVHPTTEDQLIAEITIGGRAKKLVFDGQKLTAE